MANVLQDTSLTLNASGVMCRTETLMGREWIVANMTLIVPGVLPGSEGPLLYPKDEVNRNVSAWNHIPITNEHPVHNGKPITARAPEVLDKYSMGVLLNAKGGDRLTAEGWFDVVRTKELNPSVYEKLKDGQKIELSTGLSVDRQSVLNGRTDDGKEYSGIVSNFRPDHLAVLTKSTGACSLEDGCGVNNAKTDEGASKESVVTSLWNSMLSKIFIRNELSHDNIRTELRKQLTERFSTGVLPKNDYPSSLWVMDVFKSYVVFSWEDKFWKIGYSSKGNTVSLDEGKPEEVVQVTDYKTVTNQGESQMAAMTSEEKEAVINQILGKCGCEDKKVLNALSDEALKQMQSAVVANGAAKTTTAPAAAPVQFVLPPELVSVVNYVQDLQGREKAAIINRLTSHITDATAKAAVVQGYEGMTVAQLTLVANSLPSAGSSQKKMADFSAAGSDIQNKTGQGEVKEEGLDIPVINYAEEAKIAK